MHMFTSPPSVRMPLAPEDEELLRDDVLKTPVKKDGGIKRKERPTDKGVAWLVKTQYISPLSIESAKQVLILRFFHTNNSVVVVSVLTRIASAVFD